MKKRILFLLMFMVLIPFVSAGIFDSAKSFLVGYWDNRIIGVIGVVIFFVLIIFFGRRLAGGSYARGYGSAVSRLRELRDARKEKNLGKKQLETAREIDKHVYKLRKIEDELNREESNLDRQLYTLEEYEKRLMYWEKKIGPYLIKLNDEIDKIVRYIQKGKLKNPTAAKQNLERLYEQFIMVSQKHYNLLERFRLVAEREKQLIGAKQTDEIGEEKVVGEEIKDEKSESGDIKDELKEAEGELTRLKEAGASPDTIKYQKKKIKDIVLRRRSIQRELKGEYKEEVIAKKEEGLTNYIKKHLNEQEEAINQLERIETTLAHPNMNAGLIAVNRNKLKKQLRLLKKNSGKAMKGIEKLREMDIKNIFLEERAKRLEKKRLRWSKKEEKVMARAA